MPFTEESGEAAFYGPKIDFVVRDVIGREWQLGTVQVDFNLPIRFDLSYTGADNKPHRPVMIHRAPFGSMERFVGILIEHFAGDFPTWLSPEQVRLIPLNDDLNADCEAMAEQLKAVKVRCTVDTSANKLGAKIRLAEISKVPHMLVVGAKEKEAGVVNVRSRADKSFEGNRTLADFIGLVTAEVAERRLKAHVPTPPPLPVPLRPEVGGVRPCKRPGFGRAFFVTVTSFRPLARVSRCPGGGGRGRQGYALSA